jgi:hypothetical protein
VKKCLMLAVAAALFFCGDPLRIENGNPSFFIGKWVAKGAGSPAEDTILVFNQSGKYDYSISREIDSLSRDTSYWENGSWKVEFLDVNHNEKLDLDGEEDSYLFTNPEAASISGNIGRKDYVLFDYFQAGEFEFLKILADSNTVLSTFEKE